MNQPSQSGVNSASLGCSPIHVFRLLKQVPRPGRDHSLRLGDALSNFASVGFKQCGFVVNIGSPIRLASRPRSEAGFQNGPRIVERYLHPTDEHKKSAMLRYEVAQMARGEAGQVERPN
jgi:hypothetical protein